jgi:protein-disulfide isomerase
MSARERGKVAAREARVAKQAQMQASATARRRRRMLVGTVLAGLATVVLAITISSVAGTAPAASSGSLRGVAYSASLFAGIPQRGTVLGRSNAPVEVVEFADLQCPYCDEYAVQALPSLVRDYVRTGEVSMRFENLSFIGPGSVAAGRAAAAAAQQNRLWNFVDLMYLNQGEENSGYVTPSYLRQLLAAAPGVNVANALRTSQTPSANVALQQATDIANAQGIDSTPSFLIGKVGGPLHVFQPSTLTPAPFAAAFDALLKG